MQYLFFISSQKISHYGSIIFKATLVITKLPIKVKVFIRKRLSGYSPDKIDIRYINPIQIIR